MSFVRGIPQKGRLMNWKDFGRLNPTAINNMIRDARNICDHVHGGICDLCANDLVNKALDKQLQKVALDTRDMFQSGIDYFRRGQ
jgi:hypothetical protein